MKTRIFLNLILLFFMSFNLFAQKKRLTFNSNKIFKIVQFTDMHYSVRREKSPEVIENIKVILEAEKPDLIVLTGDIVTGNEENWPTIESWETLTNLFIKYKVPYAVVFGNHDDEAQTSREELLNYLASRKNCLISDEGGDKVKGIGNYFLPVYNRDGTSEKLLYFLDSGSYSPAKDKGVDGYDWIGRSQIDWFANTNQSFLKENKNAQALMFFHIPLPEYKQAFDNGEFRKGVRMEDECSPDINTGMFAEMLQQGNVLGTFVGHDHNNNYVAQMYNIALCYGYMSGGNTYRDLPLRGARVILLEEGKQGFTTWLRRVDNKILYKVELPYIEKK
ncbi:MAG: metallophosphoesterase family protein [Bacteroidota bacterium]